MKGGYKIIDFKNVSLSGTPVTMTDVLVDLLNNYDKVVLLSHVVLSGLAKDDCYSTALSDGNGGIKLNCYDGYISINSSGAVTYTVASASGMASDIAELTAKIGDTEDLTTTDKDSVVDAINEINGDPNITTPPLTPTNFAEFFVSLVIGKCAFVGVSTSLNNTAFGVSKSGFWLIRKATETSVYIISVTSDDEFIFKARYSITNNNFINRYVFEGTALT